MFLIAYIFYELLLKKIDFSDIILYMKVIFIILMYNQSQIPRKEAFKNESNG